MKKLTLICGALVLGFFLSSCENKKETAINLFNTFFDEEIAALNQVEDADAFLAYFDAADERFSAFYANLDKQIPINEDDQIIGLSKEDSDAAMQVYEDRLAAYTEARDAKSAALYEPFIQDLEAYWDGPINDLLDQYDDVASIPDDVLNPILDTFEQKFDAADQYVRLSSEEQYDRYLVFYDLFFTDSEEETEEAE